jgi:hypothetical protein
LDFIKYHNQISLKCLVGLSVAILFGVLIFGLMPNGFFFSNGVNWIPDRPGLRFSKNGIAYTNSFIGLIEENISKPCSFSVEIALKPASYDKKGFNFILALYNRKDNNQLLMGQYLLMGEYRSKILLMNGNDYDYKKRTRRIVLNAASPSSTTRFITITSGKKGTEVYLNGQLVRTKKDLTLKIPNNSKARLLIGNSANSRHSWQGDVYGVAFYGYTLNAQEVKLHFNKWFQEQNFSFAKKDKPFVLFFFDEKEGEKAFDHAAGKNHLEIPWKMKKLEREFLSMTLSIWNFSRSSIKDIFLNLVGFIPFGFVLSATLIKIGGTFEKNDVLITVVLCFTVSLMIEIVQAWIPLRYSRMLDLILNTLGALIGAIMYRFFMVRIYSKRGLKASVGN